MPTRSRILIYDGPQEWLDEQFGRSLPSGRKIFTHTKHGAVSITAVDLHPDPILHAAKRYIEENLNE